MRTIVYVGGFNLYYGALKNTAYKWLDIRSAISHLLRPHNQIIALKYFTARIQPSFVDPTKHVRQDTYLNALSTHDPLVKIYFGHYLNHEVKLPKSPLTNPMEFVKVVKNEEKGSDVNLAVHLVNDAAQNRYDCAVVISNDSDMKEALRIAKEEYTKTIGVVTPFRFCKHRSKQLSAYADFAKTLNKTTLRKSQLPNPIPKSNLTKPKRLVILGSNS